MSETVVGVALLVLLRIVHANKAKLQGADGGLGAAAHAQLAKDATEMVAYGSRPESNLHPNLPIALPLDEQAKNLHIARRERRCDNRWGRPLYLVGTAFTERLPDELAQTLFVFQKLATQGLSSVQVRRAAHRALTSCSLSRLHGGMASCTALDAAADDGLR
jgi:hypothetical protein